MTKMNYIFDVRHAYRHGRISRSIRVMLLFFTLILSGSLFSVQWQQNVLQTARGVFIKLGQTQVELSAVNPVTLRLSVAAGNRPQPASGTFLCNNDGSLVKWRLVERGGMVGIQTKAGELRVYPQNGQWTLEDGQGKTLIPRYELNGQNIGTSAGGSSIKVMLGWKGAKPIRVYGCGNQQDYLEQSKAVTHVANLQTVIPYYWSKAGYAVLAVTADDNKPATWQAATNGEYVAWTFTGTEADLYLRPAATLKDAAKDYALLTGHAPVPPRWTFGYLQSRWG
jgi:alpha-glucosidase